MLFIVSGHVNADFDCLGSILGMYEYIMLKYGAIPLALDGPPTPSASPRAPPTGRASPSPSETQQPNVIALWPGTQTPGVRAAAEALALDNRRFAWWPVDRIAALQADLTRDGGLEAHIVIVDVAKRGRVRPELAKLLDEVPASRLALSVVDHHEPDLDDFPTDRCAEFCQVPTAGSCSGMIIERLVAIDGLASVDAASARALALGVCDDTGCFSFECTQPRDLRAMATLLEETHLDLAQHRLDLVRFRVASPVPSAPTSDDAVVIGSAADLAHDFQGDADKLSVMSQLRKSSLRLNLQNGAVVAVAAATLPREISQFAKCADALLDLDTSLNAAFLIGDFDERIVLVGRSRSERFLNCAAVCVPFGGGGHACAASASIRDREAADVREEAVALILLQAEHGTDAVSSLMTAPAKYLLADETLEDAVLRMRRFSLKKAPVVDGHETRRVLGVLDRFAAEKALDFQLHSARVAEYADVDVQVVQGTELLPVAVDIVMTTRQRCIPVVDDAERLIGVVSRADVTRLLAENPTAFATPKAVTTSLAIEMRQRLPKKLVSLMRRIGKLGDELGVRVYVAGGFVRDLLLNVENDDVDLVVEGDGVSFADALHDRLGSDIRRHRQFGTATVTIDGLKIDVATARLEYYPQPASMPAVEPSSLKMDLGRRDFSFNALALVLNAKAFGDLVDFYAGQADLTAGRVRVIHALSLVDDPTRAFRAVRFEQRYGFTITRQTARLIDASVAKGRLAGLTPGRLWTEWCKMTKDVRPVETLLRAERGFHLLSTAIHPSLSALDQGLLRAAVDAAGRVEAADDDVVPRLEYVFLMVLFRDIATLSSVLAEKFALSGSPLNEVVEGGRSVRSSLGALRRALRDQDAPTLPSTLYRLMIDWSPSALALALALAPKADDLILRFIVDLRKRRPTLTGARLRDEFGMEPSASFGPLLRRAFDAQLDGTLPSDTEGLRRYIAETLQAISDERAAGADHQSTTRAP